MMLNLLKVNSDKGLPVSRAMLPACSHSWSEGSMMKRRTQGARVTRDKLTALSDTSIYVSRAQTF